MPKIYISVLDEESPGHDDPESPNYIPFSGFNMCTISINLKEAIEVLGLKTVLLEQTVCDMILNQQRKLPNITDT
jgi:hypothetical protein